MKAEFIWMSPEVGEAGSFGGDDGLGGYMPLAVATGSGTATQLSWIHANHMGVPIRYSDASGNALPQPTGYSVPGFPGQSQTLADLYYNRYRDYDSGTGRYIQADPIGLAGGASPYSYALNNPLRYSDPTGQFVPAIVAFCITPWGAPVCGAISGAVTDLAIQAASNAWNGRNVLDWNCYDWEEVGVSAGLGAAGGAFGGRVLTSGLGRLSNSAKGDIGEALSVGWNRLKGSRRIDRDFIEGYTTKPDSVWRSIWGFEYNVESKFGKSTLTGPQRTALRELGPDMYRVERWSYDFFNMLGVQAGGLSGGIAGYGLGW